MVSETIAAQSYGIDTQRQCWQPKSPTLVEHIPLLPPPPLLPPLQPLERLQARGLQLQLRLPSLPRPQRLLIQEAKVLLVGAAAAKAEAEPEAGLLMQEAKVGAAAAEAAEAAEAKAGRQRMLRRRWIGNGAAMAMPMVRYIKPTPNTDDENIAYHVTCISHSYMVMSNVSTRRPQYM